MRFQRIYTGPIKTANYIHIIDYKILPRISPDEKPDYRNTDLRVLYFSGATAYTKDSLT